MGYANYLDLGRQNEVFALMGTAAPQVLINLDSVLTNYFELASKYHDPIGFVSAFNNLERGLYYFTETAMKSPLSAIPWLKEAMDNLKMGHYEDVVMHKQMRRHATHVRLLVPDDSSIVYGLYRIRSNSECILKLGMGDVDEDRKSRLTKYLYEPTENIFQRLLFFHETIMIGNDHSDLGECLGVTRNWFADVSYEFGNRKINRRIDLFMEISRYCDLVLNHVGESFASSVSRRYEAFSLSNLSQYNFVNTVLEIDMYPELFQVWWSDPTIEPFNFGYTQEFRRQTQAKSRTAVYEATYKDLCTSLEQYLGRMDQYSAVNLDCFEDRNDYTKYINFMYFNHLHLKNCFSFMKSKDGTVFEILMRLRRETEDYIANYDSSFSAHTPEQLNVELAKLSKTVEEVAKVVRSVG